MSTFHLENNVAAKLNFKEFFRSVKELLPNETNLEALAGFVYGKLLAPYWYELSPQDIAEAWVKCHVKDKIQEAVS